MANREESFVSRFPWPVLLLTILIPCVGALNLASAAQATRPNLFLQQLMWLGGALVIGAIVVWIKTSTWELMAIPIYVVVNGLLVLVLLVGTAIKGSQRWLDLGPMNLQPSELAKISIILIVARTFGRYRVDGGYTLRQLFRPLNLSRPLGVVAVLFLRWHKQGKQAEQFAAGVLTEAPSADPAWLKTTLLVGLGMWALVGIAVLLREGVHARRILAPVDVVLATFVLILIEPDLGTSLIVISIAGAQILFCKVKPTSLAIASVAGIVVILGAWQFVLKDYQKKRVETFLNPENDLQGAGYHSSQSMIAIGSGGVVGKGHFEGTQTQLSFLPENHTDFVFSVLAEEWGFVGGTVLILLFLLLVISILRVGRNHTEPFAALVAVGAAAMVFCHVVINIGMVTGLLPVVGVTLPFVSYGGSSMITMVVAVALSVNTAVWRRG
jgi:cell division protein FtsW (lipid II flippase)